MTKNREPKTKILDKETTTKSQNQQYSKQTTEKQNLRQIIFNLQNSQEMSTKQKYIQ